MLKGTDKGVAGENVRELKKQGMSEREAVMASMKRSPAKIKKESKVSMPSSPHEDYPYGLKLELDHETLSKLGHTSMPKVGQMMHLKAKGRVTSSSEHSSEGESGPRRSASVQITHMKSDMDGDEGK